MGIGDRPLRPNRHAYRPARMGDGHPMRSHSAFTIRNRHQEKGINTMHQLVILTALTATSGLFGGHCQSGGCGGARMMRWGAPRTACATPYNMYVVSGYRHGYAAGCATCPTAAAPAAAPQAVPAPAPAPATSAPAPAPPAPPAPTTQYGTWRPQVARAGYYYPSYYGYATSGTCPNGNCARR